MDYIPFHWMDYVFFALMVGLSIALAIYFSLFKKQNTSEDHLQGGRQIKVLPVAMSLAASTVSGIAVLGIPVEIYLYGTQYWMMVLAMIFVGFIVCSTFLPVLYKLKLISIFEYLEIRFDKKLRTGFSILLTFTFGLFISIVLYAISLAFNQVTGFNIYAIAAVILLICIFYTFARMMAVVWADTLYFIITLGTLIFVVIKGIIAVGGLSKMWEKAEQGNRLEFLNMSFDPTLRATFWSVTVGNTAGWIFVVGTSQLTIQRFLAVPTYADSKMILYIYIAFAIVIQSIVCVLGVVIYAKYDTCDPLTAGYITRSDQIVPYFIADVSRDMPGMNGLLVGGLFVTSLSTLSSFLNILSTNIYRDLICLIPSNTSTTFCGVGSKITTMVVGIIAMSLVFFVENLGTLLQMTFKLGGLYGGSLVGLYLMGMIFPIANKQGAFYGSVSSIIVMIILIVGNQIMTWNGVIQAVPRSLVTYGCSANDTSWNTTSIDTAEFLYTNLTNSSDAGSATEDKTPLWLFNISFHYYMLIGAILTITIGVFVSWMTRKETDPLVNSDLLCPFAQKYLNKASNVKFKSKFSQAHIRVPDEHTQDQCLVY